MKVIIETERLLLRTFTKKDATLIYQLNLDPEVIRFTLDSLRNIDHAKEVLENTILPQYSLYNHGRWAVHLKPGREFIGWCGLKTRPEPHLTDDGQGNETDLGYRFIQAAWGRGYATEAAKACIQYGFEKLNIPRLVGRALPGNKASIRVLEKCGMKYTGEEIIEGLLHKTYEINNPLIP